jgi:hypothetical protein
MKGRQEFELGVLTCQGFREKTAEKLITKRNTRETMLSGHRS